MDVTCNVIEDLLPLYADGICSEDSRTIVEHHVAVCTECKEKLDAMTAKIENTEPSSPPAVPKNPFKKIRRLFKIIIIALCICVVIAVPAVIGTVMAVNDIYDNGYSWSALKFENKLRKLENMLKSGKYRKFLDAIDFINQEDYTDEELSALKDMFAEDMENYFKKFPVKKIKVRGADGKCTSGELIIYIKTDLIDKTQNAGPMLSFGYSDDQSDRLCYWGDFWEFSNYLGEPFDPSDETIKALVSGFPEMELAPAWYASWYFDKLKDDEGISSMAFYLFSEEKWSNIDDINVWSKINKENEAKLRRMLESYEYVGCQGGDMTYMREDILSDYTNRFYCQHALLTMRTKDGAEFTASFDMPITLTGTIATSCFRNITYSDNTPEDFKTQFESIFTE